jgi:hypothetical protein
VNISVLEKPWPWAILFVLYCATCVFLIQISEQDELSIIVVLKYLSLSLLYVVIFIVGACLFSFFLGVVASSRWSDGEKESIVIGSIIAILTLVVCTGVAKDKLSSIITFRLVSQAEILELCSDGINESILSGAICDDGRRSSSTGRGTCSHHHGVKKWLYTERKVGTPQECAELYAQQSWLY